MKLATKGSLKDTILIEILKDAAQSELTGIIRVENAPTVKVIYLQKGTISFASSNDKSDRLTEVLKRAGKLTPEQVEDAQGRLKPNVSLGKTLLKLGYVSAKDLLWGAHSQVDAILHQLLFWNQGKYQVLQGTLPLEIVHLNLPVTTVIFDGIMKTQNREWILQHIGSPEAVYALSTNFAEQNQALKLPVDHIVSRMNGKSSLHEIAEASGIDTFEICKTVVALEYLNMASAVQDEPSQLPLVESEQPVVEQTIEQAAEPLVEQQLGQLLQLPTVEELDRTPEEKKEPPVVDEVVETQAVATKPGPAVLTEPETPAVEPAPAGESESEPVAAEAGSVPAVAEQITAPEETAAEQPGLAELERVLEAPGIDEHVPMQSMVRDPQAVARAVPKFGKKFFATILLATSAIGAGSTYYVWKENQAAESYVPPAVSLGQQHSPTNAPELRLPEASAPVDHPLQMLRNGRVADAANSWNEHFTKENHGYSIQLLIACQAKTVADTHRLLNYSDQIIVLPVNHKGQVCHRVLVGQFSSKKDARAGILALPPVFNEQFSPASVVEISKVIY